MKNKNEEFIWSDNWWIEEDDVWSVGGMSNILFHANLTTGKCDEAVETPDLDICKFRLTPSCLKYGKDIFCIPGLGKQYGFITWTVSILPGLILINPNVFRSRYSCG